MWFVSLRDLQFRQRRFFIAIAGTSLVFAMGLIGSGVAGSFRGEVHRTLDAIGADAWVVPEASVGPFTSFSLIEARHTGRVSRIEGVERADPVIVLHHALPMPDGPMDVNVVGFRRGGIGAPPVVHGRSIKGPTEIVVDDSAGIEVGEQIDVGGAIVSVVGTTRGLTMAGGTPNVYVRLASLQAAVFSGDRVATAVVTRGIPARAPAGMRIMTDPDAHADMLRPFVKAIGAIDIIRLLLWVVAASIIGAIVYLSTLERVRDFAVLRAVGSSARGLFVGLAMQAVAIAVASASLSVLIAAVLVPFFPIAVQIPGSAYVLLPIIAIGVGIAASTSGLRRAVGVDPALAFGG